MIFTISWRNIWRSRTRSLVVMGAIVVGIWALIFLLSFSSGMSESYVNNAIRNQLSHIQIHQPEFMDEKEVQYYFEQGSEKRQQLVRIPHVEEVAVRSLGNAMLSTSRGARGVQIRAVEPELEKRVTHLEEKIVDGEYFGDRKNELLLSERLADKLGVKVRSKVVLTFQDTENEITTAAFRISGLFDTGNNMYDEAVLFIKRTDFNRLLDKEDIAHELAILLTDSDALDNATAEAQKLFPNLLVQTYREISPDVQLYESQLDTTATIFIFIVMLALVFGIINTMLMAVLERMKELGMLMAVGMNKLRVFAMIMLETIMLALVAAPIGMLLGYGTVSYFGKVGISLEAFSQGMQQFGLSEIVYLSLSSGIYIQLAIAVVITAIVGSIYPAFKAIRLRPVEALQKI